GSVCSRSGWSSLMATLRRICRSYACQTSPVLPRPNSCCSSYLLRRRGVVLMCVPLPKEKRMQLTLTHRYRSRFQTGVQVPVTFVLSFTFFFRYNTSGCHSRSGEIGAFQSARC